MQSLDKSPYDLTTFQGRLQHFTRLTSPANLFVSRRHLEDCQRLLQDYRSQYNARSGIAGFFSSNAARKFDMDAVWRAKYTVDSCLHPDTSEPVLLPFRMSSFVPTNLLVTAGMLLPTRSLFQVAMWQWVNQSVNVGFNWANANKSTPLSIQETAVAYSLAVSSSVVVAVGLSRWVQATKMLSDSARLVTGRLVPFVAVASAGVLNVLLMRQKELTVGIDVYPHFDTDENASAVSSGKSSVAGWSAVSQVAISRVATAFPCLTIPPLILSRIERLNWFKGNSIRLGAANLIVIGATLMTALPVAVALFPQRGVVEAARLEPQFRSLKDSRGREIKYFSYNKGL